MSCYPEFLPSIWFQTVLYLYILTNKDAEFGLMEAKR